MCGHALEGRGDVSAALLAYSMHILMSKAILKAL